MRKAQISQLGMQRDRNRRESLVRFDDAERQGKVSAARKLIYGKKGRMVNSTFVEALLKDQSLVPTIVSSIL
jgi:hypothetical protein